MIKVSEFVFDIENTSIIRYARYSYWSIFRYIETLERILKPTIFLVFALFVYALIFSSYPVVTVTRIAGLTLLLIITSLVARIVKIFYQQEIVDCPIESRVSDLADNPLLNLASLIDIDAAKAIDRTINYSTKRGIVVHSATLLHFILRDNPRYQFVFNRLLLNYSSTKEAVKKQLANIPSQGDAKYHSEFIDTINKAVTIALDNKHLRITASDLFTALAESDSFFKEILVRFQLKAYDIRHLARWLEYLDKKTIELRRYWDWQNLMKLGTMAKSFASGYTITLDQFSTDLTDLVQRRGFPDTVGHIEEIKEVERILSKNDNNEALIVGEPGSGRRSIVQAIAVKSALGASMPTINYRRVVQLNLPSLLAQAGSVDEAETLLDKIFQEVISAGNVILVIDDLHNFISETARLGMIDISGIFSPYLSQPNFRVIAITTFTGLHQNIEQNQSLLSLFEKVEVTDVSEEDTLILLENLCLMLEKRYRRMVSFPALRSIISLSGRYIPTTPFPEKAMELLEEVMVYVSQMKFKVVLPEHVAKVVTLKTKIPVGEIEEKEKEVLMNLEELIHERIVNQEEAIKEISGALRRARAGIGQRNAPMGTFLFLGPTGVGKTESAKALAAIYFGSEERMIRLDMSEFQNINDIGRLIGKIGEEGLLTTKVREMPFSLVLLDEIEKAHLNILNIFLQVLDEGYLTDGMGRKVDFRSTIIIATSNAGYQVILEALKNPNDWANVKSKILDYLFKEAIFRPEFINRFDAAVVFKPLSQDNLLKISALLLKKIQKNLKEKDINFAFSLDLQQAIVGLSYNPVFGAREMKRVIQDRVENVLANALLGGQLVRGNRVEVMAPDFTLKID
ncbi:MAG: ATP-dependent Clp protease ATP-binding subunit [bacterium]